MYIHTVNNMFRRLVFLLLFVAVLVPETRATWRNIKVRFWTFKKVLQSISFVCEIGLGPLYVHFLHFFLGCFTLLGSLKALGEAIF
jgi:hypothetical protein